MFVQTQSLSLSSQPELRGKRHSVFTHVDKDGLQNDEGSTAVDIGASNPRMARKAVANNVDAAPISGFSCLGQRTRHAYGCAAGSPPLPDDNKQMLVPNSLQQGLKRRREAVSTEDTTMGPTYSRI